MILKDRNRFECLQNSIIFVYYFWKYRRVSKSNFTIVWRTNFVLHTNQREKTSFYTLWSVIKAFYMISCWKISRWSRNSLLQCNTIFIWIMWIVQINSEVNWRYHDPNKSNERNELVNSVNKNAYIVWNHHQSTKNFNHRDRRVFTQKLIEKLLRSSNIIHQSSKCIKSTYCKWNDCSINFHTKSRKRQTFNFKSVNIQHRSNRKTFDYCMTCKMNLCVSFECFKIYHDSKKWSYECFDQ